MSRASHTLIQCCKKFKDTVIKFVSFTMGFSGGGMSAGANIGSVQNAMGIIYSSVSYQGMFNLVTVMPVVAIERLVLYRHASLPSPALSTWLYNFHSQLHA